MHYLRVGNIIYPKSPFSHSNIIFVHRTTGKWYIVNYNKPKMTPPDLCLSLNSGLLLWKSTLDYPVSKFIILAPKQPLSAAPTPSPAHFPPEHPLPKGTVENRVMGPITCKSLWRLRSSVIIILPPEIMTYHYLFYLTMSILTGRTERKMIFYFECQNPSPFFQQK